MSSPTAESSEDTSDAVNTVRNLPNTISVRDSCDTNNVQGELRMCWHTSGGNLSAGYRCGLTTTFGADWERVVFTAP